MRGYFSVVGIFEQRFSSALSQISGLTGQKRSQGSSGRVGWLRVIPCWHLAQGIRLEVFPCPRWKMGSMKRGAGREGKAGEDYIEKLFGHIPVRATSP